MCVCGGVETRALGRPSWPCSGRARDGGVLTAAATPTSAGRWPAVAVSTQMSASFAAPAASTEAASLSSATCASRACAAPSERASARPRAARRRPLRYADCASESSIAAARACAVRRQSFCADDPQSPRDSDFSIESLTPNTCAPTRSSTTQRGRSAGAGGSCGSAHAHRACVSPASKPASALSSPRGAHACLQRARGGGGRRAAGCGEAGGSSDARRTMQT